jgi:hypothetical protein
MIGSAIFSATSGGTGVGPGVSGILDHHRFLFIIFIVPSEKKPGTSSLPRRPRRATRSTHPPDREWKKRAP